MIGTGDGMRDRRRRTGRRRKDDNQFRRRINFFVSAIVLFSLLLLLSPFALAAIPDSDALVPAKEPLTSQARLTTLEVDGRCVQFGNSFATK